MIKSRVRNFWQLVGIPIGIISLVSGCGLQTWRPPNWQAAVDKQLELLGYRNWIVIAEASFPAYHRNGLRQVNADVEIPEALDYVLQAMERTENTRPNVYLARELRSVENDYAPGIEELRTRLKNALHGHETIQIDHQSLQLLLEEANRSFDILVIRTDSALPYSSVYLELLPGYWDADAEDKLRERIQIERQRKKSQAMR